MSKPIKLTMCQRCGEDNLSVRFSNKGARMLEQYCRSTEWNGDYDVRCLWVGEAYIPKKRPIKTTKTVNDPGHWCYELFDQYGQVVMYSQGFSSEKIATANAKKVIENSSKIPGYGKCVAVMWPPKVKITGKLIK